jgi:adenylate cyclase
MSLEPHGELVPVGGGDAIPLVRERLTLGRRESCDICLRLPNVSGLHCELFFRDGFWWIQDLNSTNGIKVNGARVPKKLLHSGDTITIAKRTYTVEYTESVPTRGMDEVMEDEDTMGQSLLEKAGLARPKRAEKKPPAKPGQPSAKPQNFSLDDDD